MEKKKKKMNTILLSKYYYLKVSDDLQHEALALILGSRDCMEYLMDNELLYSKSTKQLLYMLKVISALVALKNELELDTDFLESSDMEVRSLWETAQSVARLLERECQYLTESDALKETLDDNGEFWYDIVFR